MNAESRRRELTIRITPRACAWAGMLGVLLAVSAAAGLYFLRVPILTVIGRQLINEDALRPADAIVVLAGGTPEREIEAADLYREGFAPLVILPRGLEYSGPSLLRARGVTFEPEIELRRRVLRELGVAETALVTLEPAVDSTVEEARAVGCWAGARGFESLIIVTSAFHTGRAKFVYQRVLDGRGIAFRVRATRADLYRPESWWQSRATLRNGLIELQKQLFYRLWY
jgi:uncharacterized SAM-binding protein YcdF (DUF218 family)